MNKSETWDICAQDYLTTTQNVTGRCIVELLEELSLLPVTSSAPTIKVIDIAAGTGILAILLGEAYSQAGQFDKITILSTDFSKVMMQKAQTQFNARNWPETQLSTRVADATDLVDIPSDFYTHAFCTFGLMLIPNASKAINEMFRVLQSTGTIGIATWQKVGWFPIVMECVSRAKKACPSNEEQTVSSNNFLSAWSDASYVQQVLEDGGFENVRTKIFESRWSFNNQNQCVEQITQAQWIQPILASLNLTSEQRLKYIQLAPQILLDLIGNNPDQAFDLSMIAILAYGQKPAQ